MDVGHGQFGLRSDLRIFDQHKDESACRSDAFIEVEGGAIVQDTWTPVAGAGFEYPWLQDFDGEVFDVATVSRRDLPTLTRVETEAELVATELTWQYDLTEGVLRVHLPGDEDPSGSLVRITSNVVNVSSGGARREHMVHPYLGTDQLVDGDFDEPGLPDWNPTFTGAGFAADRDATPLVGGGYSALLQGDGSGAGSARLIQQPTSANGKPRRLFGYYSTDADQPSTAKLYVRVGTTAQLTADGITTEAIADGIELKRTFGRTRAFVFDFVNFEADVRIGFRLVNSAATPCSARLDRCRQRPIHGWRLFHPRLAADGVPESQQGSVDVYPGSASTGAGVVKFLNDDVATFERIFSGSPWTCLSRDVRIRYGGTFPDNGQEILWDDMFIGQKGIVAGDQFEVVTDEDAAYSFEDARNIFEALIPDDTYGDHFGCEERDLSRPRARFFGEQFHLRPSRIDISGTTGLGIYEVNDATYAVGDAMSVLVYAFLDEESAEANDAARRRTLTQGVDYTVDLAGGTFEVVQNPGLFQITGGENPDAKGANDRIDFVANGVADTASIPHEVYLSSELRGEVELQMEAESGGSFTVTYDNTTHKFTIQWNGAGTLKLLAGTGDNKHRSALNIMGFTASEDYDTGATSYTSDVAVFSDPDTQNFIRCDATGYRDDPAGTYTGTPDALVTLGPDIFRYVLHEMLREPVSSVDMPSFLAARTDCPQALGVYLGVLAAISQENGTQAGPISVQQLVDRLEVSGTSTAAGVADIVLTGEGVWTWRNRATTATSSVALYDRDYLATFVGSRNGNDPYGLTRVNYAQDPSTAYVLGVLRRNEETIDRDGRPHLRAFDSFLLDPIDADDAVEALSFLTRSAIRHFRLRVMGALLGANPGDIITITRSRAMQGQGGGVGLDAVEFRILYLKKNYLTREVEAVVHTNIVA